MSDKYEEQNHSWRTELPNIIWDLGLDPYEITVYCYMKRVAGDGGQCYQSRKKMAAKCGMSERKFREVKVSLAKKRIELNNQSLIHIQKRKSVDGDPDTDLITIINIWPINFQKYNGGAQPAPGVGHHVPEGGAPPAPKEELFKEEPPPPKKKEDGGGGLHILSEQDLQEMELLLDVCKDNNIPFTRKKLHEFARKFGSGNLGREVLLFTKRTAKERITANNPIGIIYKNLESKNEHTNAK